jgi:glutathione S-transferase
MSSCAQKVRFVLAEKALIWDGEELDLREGDQFKPEFLKINPKGLVPALVDDDHVVTESNIIIEYLEDKFPDRSLMPQNPADRAHVRMWMKKLDDGIHMEVIAISFAIAFRRQLTALGLGRAGMDAMLNKVPDPYTRDVQKQVVHDGIDAPRFASAIIAFDKLFEDMNAALAKSNWLVADRLTLADIAYAPYVVRMDHLQILSIWDDKPHLMAWYEQVQNTEGFKRGLEDWFPPKYLDLMKAAGLDARERVSSILDKAPKS